GILEERGSLEEAARSLRTAIYLSPKYVILHFALANLAFKRGRPEESSKHFENVLGLLSTYQRDDIVPELGGLTAGRLREMIALRNHEYLAATGPRSARRERSSFESATSAPGDGPRRAPQPSGSKP